MVVIVKLPKQTRRKAVSAYAVSVYSVNTYLQSYRKIETMKCTVCHGPMTHFFATREVSLDKSSIFLCEDCLIEVATPEDRLQLLLRNDDIFKY